MRNGLLTRAAIFLPVIAVASTLGLSAAEHREITPDQISWGSMPAGLPSGAQSVVLSGDPGKNEPFVIRIKAPGGYAVPPHSHSKDEDVTVISGRVGLLEGEKLEKKADKLLPAGSFVHMPAGMKHYAWTEEDSIVQISGMGPFDITYVNAQDDPRNQPQR